FLELWTLYLDVSWLLALITNWFILLDVLCFRPVWLGRVVCAGLEQVDANLCDLQNIGLPEDSFLSPFSLSLALFSCPLLPYYFQQLQKVSWRIVEREVVMNRPRKHRSEV
ncbi:hypothetical protein Taro_055299, partial [Colocasia esculenta]|nr:hypothetical protein [Colocasia esculenta]